MIGSVLGGRRVTASLGSKFLSSGADMVDMVFFKMGFFLICGLGGAGGRRGLEKKSLKKEEEEEEEEGG